MPCWRFRSNEFCLLSCCDASSITWIWILTTTSNRGKLEISSTAKDSGGWEEDVYLLTYKTLKTSQIYENQICFRYCNCDKSVWHLWTMPGSDTQGLGLVDETDIFSIKASVLLWVTTIFSLRGCCKYGNMDANIRKRLRQWHCWLDLVQHFVPTLLSSLERNTPGIEQHFNLSLKYARV